MVGWFTLTGLVALVSATFGVVWQRNVENRFLVGREKRELYRTILRALDACMKQAWNSSSLMSSEPYRELDLVMAELELLANTRVLKAARSAQSELVNLNNEGPDDGMPAMMRETLYASYMSLLNSLVKEMRADIDATTRFLPLCPAVLSGISQKFQRPSSS